MTTRWPDKARRRLLDLRRGPGAWGYRPGTAPATEPTALAGLALLATGGDGPDRGEAASAAGRWLGSIRRGDGSVGVTSALPEPGWATPMALLLWAALGGFEAERSAATRWLLATRGKPMAREAGGPLGHDTTLIGWPWVAETHSWVEPTAMSLIALAREGRAGHARSLDGVRVLRDRAIAGGGWNLGNPVVFGTTLRPLPGPTGLALLALASVEPGLSPSVGPALAYLRSALETTLAPVSMGWGLLGLRAWGESPAWATDRLALAFGRLAPHGPTAVDLAMLLLASSPRSLDVLGIVARHDDKKTEAGHV